MRNKCLGYIVAASLLLAQTAPPAFAQRRGATGPRGGTAHHSGGPRRGATTVTGPRGGTAGRAYGPRGSVSGARGPARRRCSTRHRPIRAIGGRSARATRRRGLLPQLVRLGWPSVLSPGVEREPDQRVRAALRGLSRLACLWDLWFDSRAGGVHGPRFSVCGLADR